MSKDGEQLDQSQAQGGCLPAPAGRGNLLPKSAQAPSGGLARSRCSGKPWNGLLSGESLSLPPGQGQAGDPSHPKWGLVAALP